MKRFLLTAVCIILMVFLYSDMLCAGEVKDEALMSVVKKVLGEKTEIIKVEPPEESPVSNWKQIRIWYRTSVGDIPVLFYKSDDGKLYFAGTIFNPEGENLTRKTVGEMIPRKIPIEDMKLNDEYRIGKTEAPVKIVFWLDGTNVSLAIWKELYEIYTKNSDRIVIFLKFLPATTRDINRLFALSCYKGDNIEKGLTVLSDVSPLWGENREGVIDFLKSQGVDLERCEERDVKADMELASTLKLPRGPLVFVNGILLLTSPIKDGISQLSGVELK
ncbi:MAG: hypothetical protein HXY53_04865 [Nitrospirae bacterium]|nr:hypothetical protein [Nitrospirota bacterium]